MIGGDGAGDRGSLQPGVPAVLKSWRIGGAGGLLVMKLPPPFAARSQLGTKHRVPANSTHLVPQNLQHPTRPFPANRAYFGQNARRQVDAKLSPGWTS